MANDCTLSTAPLQIIDGDRGKHYPSQEQFSPVGHCLFLNTGNVTSNGFSFSNCMFISEERDNLLRKGKLGRYDIVMTTRGTVGNIAFYNDRVPFSHIRINSGMVIFRCDQSKLEPQYFYYYLKSPLTRDMIKSFSTGSAQPQLPISDINQLSIKIPPLPVQKAIAHILGTLDDKIELLRQMNETLEAMARALFKSWFVDFDPVRKKAVGLPTGLPSEIDALFPDSFEDSELGEIPKGWRIERLNAIAALETRSISPNSHPDKLYYHYSIPAFDVNKMPAYEYGASIKSNKYRVFPNSVLVSKLNPTTPRIWLPALVDGTAICSTEFMQFIPRLSIRYYLYELLSSQPVYDEILKRVTGSTGSRQRAQPSQIAVLPILSPSDTLASFFESLVSPIFSRIQEHRNEASSLILIRDSLLPRLISGDLEVKDIDKILEPAI